MRILIICLLGLFLGNVTIDAQSKKPLSPAKTTSLEVGDITIEVNYNAPSTRNRVIWGDLVPYNEIWRTGANSATKLTVSGDVNVEDEILQAGTYSLFTIPGEETFTVIVNRVSNQWGAYTYDDSEDVLRVEVEPYELEESVEQLIFDTDGATVILKWSNLAVPINFSTIK